MGAYIQRLLGCDRGEASAVQKKHFHEHGTTLAGLMKDSMTSIRTNSSTTSTTSRSTACSATSVSARLLARLPGRKFIFTNGDAPYARRVLEAIGVGDHFDELHDIHASEYRPKPDPHGYRIAVRAVRDRSRARRCSSTTWSRTSRPPRRSE